MRIGEKFFYRFIANNKNLVTANFKATKVDLVIKIACAKNRFPVIYCLYAVDIIEIFILS